MAGKLETAFGGARQSGVQAHEKQKLYYDGAVRHTPYTVGDLVWLHNPTEDRMKLAPHWKGPYRVLAVLGSQGELGITYRIACPLDSDGRTQVVHYDRLKRYTLPLLSGLSSCPPTSPLHAQPQQDEGPSYGGWTAEEPLVAVGTGVPQQTVSRSGRAVRQPVHFKDFISYGY